MLDDPALSRLGEPGKEGAVAADSMEGQEDHEWSRYSKRSECTAKA
jgi:hypothetical protein